MSQLDNVLRRSIAHLDPSDREARERVFASAREAMIRLLHVYDPPLTTDEIDSKIAEFDVIVGVIDAERRLARPIAETRLLEAAGVFGGRGRAAMRALPPPEAPLLPDPPDEEAFEVDEAEPFEDEADIDDDEDRDPDWDPDEDGYEEETYYDDEDIGPKDRFLDMVDAIGWRLIAAAGVLVILLGGIAAALLFHGRAPAPVSAIEAPAEPLAQPPAEPAPAATPAVASPAEPVPPPVVSPGSLALESLVLFDGRDPSVFQSAPENPVTFQGDADGGFARISSSTGSTGARVQVGRGVYQRIAGHQVRIVLVARAARTAPATGLRFAYQNGRVQSPWTDVALGPTYAPVSMVWVAPRERGGPEFDSLLIEPGIPGDGTAADIRSVRIEILN